MVSTDNGTGGVKELRPLGGPHSFFKRMRVLCNGQIVEDIDDYNRVHEMFSVLTAADSRENVSSEGFGENWNLRNWSTLNTTNFKGIDSGESQTVLFKPLSGLLNQAKYLPLRYAPLTIELELVSDATTPIVSYMGGTEANAFAEANTSITWEISKRTSKMRCVCS